MTGEQTPLKKLTPRQRMFVEAYIRTWNASEAARQAGMKGKANVVGPRALANVSIRAAIEQRLSEVAMQADEVLARLADMARASIGEFIYTGPTEDDLDAIRTLQEDERLKLMKAWEERKGKVNYDAIRQRGHLIKAITSTNQGTRIELYDALEALSLIGKHLRLFDDHVNHSGQIEIVGLAEALEMIYKGDDDPDPDNHESK